MQTEKHNPIGIASFAISIAAFMILSGLLGILGMMQAIFGEDTEIVQVVTGVFGAGFLLCIPLNLVALGLGITGLAQNNGKKILALWGTIASIVDLFFMLILMFVGMLAD